MESTKILLDENEMPKKWYNIIGSTNTACTGIKSCNQ